MGGVALAWLTEIGVITYRAKKKGTDLSIQGLPVPSQYLSTFAIYGVLSVTAEKWPGASAAAGWAFVLATVLNLYNTTTPKASTTGPVGPQGAVNNG